MKKILIQPLFTVRVRISRMKWITVCLAVITLLTRVSTCISHTSGQVNEIPAPIYKIKMPAGYAGYAPWDLEPKPSSYS